MYTYIYMYCMRFVNKCLFSNIITDVSKAALSIQYIGMFTIESYHENVINY